MSHAYVSNLMHCTFSTKDRYPFIDSDLELRLWPYLGGIARENRMKALAIGGTTDHLHALRVLSLSRPLRGLTHHYNRDPTDKSVGYVRLKARVVGGVQVLFR